MPHHDAPITIDANNGDQLSIDSHRAAIQRYYGSSFFAESSAGIENMRKEKLHNTYMCNNCRILLAVTVI